MDEKEEQFLYWFKTSVTPKRVSMVDVQPPLFFAMWSTWSLDLSYFSTQALRRARQIDGRFGYNTYLMMGPTELADFTS